MNIGNRTKTQSQQGIMAKIWIFSGLLVIEGNSLLIGISPFLAHLLDKTVLYIVSTEMIQAFANTV
jgi:hypothetical protein